MRLEDYQSGKFIQMQDYKAFVPSKINYNWEWSDTKLNKLLFFIRPFIFRPYKNFKIISCFFKNYFLII